MRFFARAKVLDKLVVVGPGLTCLAVLDKPDRLVEGAFNAILEPGLTLCIEALVGEVDGDHMIKLEDQGVVTDIGYETISTYPLDERLFSITS